MTQCKAELGCDLHCLRPLVVRFLDLELSLDAGIFLARPAEAQVPIDQRLAVCIENWCDPHKVTHRYKKMCLRQLPSLSSCLSMDTGVTKQQTLQRSSLTLIRKEETKPCLKGRFLGSGDRAIESNQD